MLYHPLLSMNVQVRGHNDREQRMTPGGADREAIGILRCARRSASQRYIVSRARAAQKIEIKGDQQCRKALSKLTQINRGILIPTDRGFRCATTLS